MSQPHVQPSADHKFDGSWTSLPQRSALSLSQIRWAMDFSTATFSPPAFSNSMGPGCLNRNVQSQHRSALDVSTASFSPQPFLTLMGPGCHWMSQPQRSPFSLLLPPLRSEGEGRRGGEARSPAGLGCKAPRTACKGKPSRAWSGPKGLG